MKKFIHDIEDSVVEIEYEVKGDSVEVVYLTPTGVVVKRDYHSLRTLEFHSELFNQIMDDIEGDTEESDPDVAWDNYRDVMFTAWERNKKK